MQKSCLRGRVEVNGSRITTRNIVIATGARPLVPAIAGLDDVDSFNL